ncbi:family 16 glycoside hydrolase [Roseiconus lacunae]|uniref:DUF1080 domain-containing protein n=1 Tax=Roseiconus lacunae TaxID=2605694 RepID=A0ABT7PEF1_9BACT|nr:family 16 glycoside hydrolase [Roseiconus lacunae]MCD0462883.1 DUF1080 domain-containing protein [Roseiconus lacunae]MDM4014875.1 DUF1080 domain-containing protein [Roseiconus lacunae]WRQ50464.1 family 16 glycoside hydrolase [Stieleria sp. HD01]
MKTIVVLSLTLVACNLVSNLRAEEFDTLLFSDEFESESLDRRWGSWKSESMIRDGVLVGITPKDADHPSVNSIDFEPQSDLEISVSFRFQGSPSLSVMIRDLDYKGSHAGHICHVAIKPNSVTLYDGKTGLFRKDIRDKRKAGQKLDAKTKALVKRKTSRNSVKLDQDAWHDLVIRISGDVMEVFVDGEKTGRLRSEGIAHATKSNMNLTTVDREVLYDHFALRAR